MMNFLVSYEDSLKVLTGNDTMDSNLQALTKNELAI
jgi:hypothetical protein